jgi:alkanesulfonate monooxygenase
VLDFHWFLPTYGDPRGIVGGGHGLPAGAAGGDRPASLDYLTQVSSAAEQMGFQGALAPTGTWCEDAWVTTAMLVRSTRRLKFLVAFRPGLMSPTLAAQMAATFQWQSQGRLLLNVVTGGEAHEQRAFGGFLNKDERYERCEEFLTIVRRLWSGSGPVSFEGRHLSVEEAGMQRRPEPAPQLYRRLPHLGRAGAGSRREACVGPASRQGRRAAHAVRHPAARDLSRHLRCGVGRGAAAARSASRLGRRAVAPNLWAGIGLARGGAGTALVGSHHEVADRIEEYADLGISEFVLSGHPHLEEAYSFGEGVLPILRDRGLWSHPDRAAEGAEWPRAPREWCRSPWHEPECRAGVVVHTVRISRDVLPVMAPGEDGQG